MFFEMKAMTRVEDFVDFEEREMREKVTSYLILNSYVEMYHAVA